MKAFALVILVIAFLGVIAVPSYGMGVADFVAVADRSSSAVINPAGLANLDGSVLNWEHRFTDRDKGDMDSDDLIVYTAPGMPGNGALFYGYSQDLVTVSYPGLYWRTVSYGYAYGWRVNENVNMGLTLKGVNLSSYNSFTDIQQTYETGLMLDLGSQLKINDKVKLGLAVHNIGRNMQDTHFNYATTVGIAYQNERYTAAAEIVDYLNEGGNPQYKLGFRYNLSESFQPWAILLVTDNGHLGGAVGAAYQNAEHLMLDASWFVYSDNSQNISSIKLTVGYRF